ncbi:hypothetical protein GCM10009804_05250 [Kribbella hippodromi]|uniref:Uncharacterized protein n=1 Tax=Kribbella hippodromi TaxID=434347 RepID=A0ABP4MWD8_9ACTN
MRSICAGVEIARVADDQKPATPDPYGPVEVVEAASSAAAGRAAAVWAEAVWVCAAMAAAAAAPAVTICRRFGVVCFLTGELCGLDRRHASPDLTASSLYAVGSRVTRE